MVASQFTKAEGWDECILTNQYGQVCEALNSNIFVVNGAKFITPDLDSGCVNGVMRSYLLWMLEGNFEERAIEADELLKADEILLCNAVKGVQWVKDYKGKIFAGNRATELTAMLNSKLLGV